MEMRDLMIEDEKRRFRRAQIEGEGNDPALSGVTYGTPHDLASMYGRRATSTPKGGEPGSVPKGYEEIPEWGEPGPEGGRPREKASVYGTTANPVGGRDPLGQHGMKGGFPSDADNVNEAKAQLVYKQNEDTFKRIVFKADDKSEESSLLNEENIKDLGK